MSGLIKSFGVLIVGILCAFLMMNTNRRLVLEDEIFENTRMTQLTAMQESIQLGELFVNESICIDEDRAKKKWIEVFKNNLSNNLIYKVEFLKINEEPAAIAVKVKGFSSMSMSEKELELEFMNILICDEKGE